MKKTIKAQLISWILVIVVFLGTLFVIGATKGKSVTCVYPRSGAASADDIRVVTDPEGIVRVTDIRLDDDHVHITYTGVAAGRTGITVYDGKEQIGSADIKMRLYGFLYDYTSKRMGAYNMMLGVCTVFFALLAFFAFGYFWKTGTELYSYRRMYYNGFGIFMLNIAILFAVLFVRTMTDPENYTGFNVIDLIVNAGWIYMKLTSPFIILFAVLMTVSNISLMKHESRRFRNALGIMIGLGLIIGEALGLALNTVLEPVVENNRALQALAGSYSIVFVYFECALLGSIISGVLAARHEPAPDIDYVMILGCKFRRDGTLYPLLQGRADRAVAFYRKQFEKTGRAPVLVPSGGQGPDEVMPEGIAIANYLRTQGIPDKDILPEIRSRNTFENMKFSKELIESKDPEAKCAFATTNYHVFRAGLWARRAGFMADGMGSDTKWYFWPNAFMREVVGLLEAEPFRILLTLVVFIALYAGMIFLMAA